eukprot:g2510.t1
MLGTPLIGSTSSAAALGLHATKDRPVVLPNGEIGIRPMMYLALTYDHRLVDGREAVTFLCMVRDQVEDDPQFDGAMRGAMAGADGTDEETGELGESNHEEETAKAFAVKVLDQVLGAGSAWASSGFTRASCPSCGEGYDSEAWHLAVCPAAGRQMLRPGDEVRVFGLEKLPQLNGKVGQLQRFVNAKQRWVLRVEEKDMLFKASNLEKVKD